MELSTAIPDWLTWIAAGGVGAVALAAFARMVEAALDLDAR